MDKFPEGFEHRWLLVPNADTYFMSPEDFAPKVDSKPEPDPPLDESAAKVPTANEKLQQFIDNCGTAPVALFTSEVVPHEGSR